MTLPFGSHCGRIDNRMSMSSGCHFQIKKRTKSSSHILNRKIPLFAIDSVPNPKSTTLISTKNYKHKKLLTYCLFQGLIKDLEE